MQAASTSSTVGSTKNHSRYPCPLVVVAVCVYASEHDLPYVLQWSSASVFAAHLAYYCITAPHTVLSQERHQSARRAQIKLYTAL
eukprot:6131-Heterococcus_DN1.PRE.3